LIGVFYYTLGNISPIYRSQLKCIQLLAIAKRPVIKEYGSNIILERFMIDLALLEQVSDLHSSLQCHLTTKLIYYNLHIQNGAFLTIYICEHLKKIV